MGLNPVFSETSDVEKKLFEIVKELIPSTAYIYGIEERAGKFLIPSKKNIATAKKKLSNILRKTNERRRL